MKREERVVIIPILVLLAEETPHTYTDTQTSRHTSKCLPPGSPGFGKIEVRRAMRVYGGKFFKVLFLQLLKSIAASARTCNNLGRRSSVRVLVMDKDLK